VLRVLSHGVRGGRSALLTQPRRDPRRPERARRCDALRVPPPLHLCQVAVQRQGRGEEDRQSRLFPRHRHRDGGQVLLVRVRSQSVGLWGSGTTSFRVFGLLRVTVYGNVRHPGTICLVLLGGDSPLSKWRVHLLKGLVQTAVSVHLQRFGE
jgi:hypothetical protein